MCRLFVCKTGGPPKRDFIKENVKNLKSMKQHNHSLNDIASKNSVQRKTRSTSQSRLCSSSNKSIENGKKIRKKHFFFTNFTIRKQN